MYDDMRAGGHREYWIKGGRGSGKSSFAAFVILRTLMADPDANCAVYRRVAGTLKDSVYALMQWATRRMGVEALFRFKRSPLEIEYLPTGQRILFRGADDPLKSKSITVPRGHFKLLWFEETGEFRSPQDLRSIVQSVLRGADDGLVLCTFNPPRSPRSWINEACLEPRPGRMLLHTTYLDLPREWLGERFLSEAQVLKRFNPQAWKNEYLGEVTGESGQVFTNLELRQIPQSELMALDKRFYGLDFGFAADPDALTEWAFDRKSATLFALSEHVVSGESPQALSLAAKQMAGRRLIVCDSAEPRMISQLKSLGVNAVGARKGPGSREHGYRFLQTLSRIVIDPARTPTVAREFTTCEYETDPAGRPLSAYPDRDDHTIDACRYALEKEMTPRKARIF